MPNSPAITSDLFPGLSSVFGRSIYPFCKTINGIKNSANDTNAARGTIAMNRLRLNSKLKFVETKNEQANSNNVHTFCKNICPNEAKAKKCENA